MTAGFNQALRSSSGIMSLKRCAYDNDESDLGWREKYFKARSDGGDSYRLSGLHRAITELSKMDFDDLFVTVERWDPPIWVEKKTRGLSFIQLLKFDYAGTREANPGYKMSPLFVVAEEISSGIALELRGMHNFRTQNERFMNCLRVHFNELKRRVNDASTIAAMDSFRRCANANFNSAVEFVERCGRKRANLLVLRLDLYYRSNLVQSLGEDESASAVTPAVSRRHRSSFHKELWRRFGEALIGFMWCMEWGKTRKLHFHYLIFLDSSKHQQDVLHCRALGEYWKHNATQGLGDYFNVNARAEKSRAYTSRAVGKVDLTKPEVQEGLRLIVAYFTLSRAFMKLDVANACRTFGHTKAPSTSRGPGRPSKLRAPLLPGGFSRSLQGLIFI